MSLKKAYLYLVSVISLVIWVIGAIMLLNMALKTWVFTKADRDYYSYACPMSPGSEKCTAEQDEMYRKQSKDNRSAQKQRDAAQALSFIIVGVPVWFGHWRLAKKEV